MNLPKCVPSVLLAQYAFSLAKICVFVTPREGLREVFGLGDISAQPDARPPLLTCVPISHGVASEGTGPIHLSAPPHHTHTEYTHSSYGSDTCRGRTKCGPLIKGQRVGMDTDLLTSHTHTHTHTTNTSIYISCIHTPCAHYCVHNNKSTLTPISATTCK